MHIQQQIQQELQAIPENKLIELYQLIHHFRLKTKSKIPERTAGILTSKVSDSFFEPLPEEELQAWE